MIWFGLARVIESDFARGLAIAEKTPLPAWPIRFAGMRRRALPGAICWCRTSPTTRRRSAGKELQILAFGLRNDANAPMPKDWPAVARSLCQIAWPHHQ